MKRAIPLIGWVLVVLLCGCDYGFGPIFPESDSAPDHEVEPDFDRWQGEWRFTLSDPFPSAVNDTSVLTFDDSGTGRARLILQVDGQSYPFYLTLQLNSWGYLQNPPRCLTTASANPAVRILSSGFWMSGPLAPADSNHGTYTALYILSSAASDTVFGRGTWSAYRLETQ